MTEPDGPENRFALDELAGYLEQLEAEVDAHVTEARLLGLHTRALNAIGPAPGCPIPTVGHGAMAIPLPPTHPAATNPHAAMPDSWPSNPSPFPTPPIPVPPVPAPPLPAPLPMPPLPTEPVPAPPTMPTVPTWHEPEDGGRDTGQRGTSKRQR